MKVCGIFFAIISILTCFNLPLLADDSQTIEQESLEELLSGFEDETTSVTRETKVKTTPSMLELHGAYVLSSAYNYAHDAPDEGDADYRGFSRLRGLLELELDMRFPGNWKARISGHGFYDAIYSVRGRDEYTNDVLHTYESELEFDEVYLQGPIRDKLDLKVGRQIVVWGKSDNIRITDVLNPLDNREPGMVDIKYLRLPVTMTRLDYHFGNWDLTGILIHEPRFSKRPVFGSDFFPLSSVQPPEKEPACNLENTQYAAALSGIFSGWDIAFYAADIFDDKWHKEGNWRRHKRIKMLGAALDIAKGNWLFKTEAAYLTNLRYSALPYENKTRYDVLAGVEYRGFSDTLITLEIANRHIVGFEEEMGNPPDYAQKDEFQSALRLSRDFLNETLQLNYLLLLFDPNGSGGGYQRFWAEYDLNDSLKLTAGIVSYISGDTSPFHTIGDNDRIFAELRYSF